MIRSSIARVEVGRFDASDLGGGGFIFVYSDIARARPGEGRRGEGMAIAIDRSIAIACLGFEWRRRARIARPIVRAERGKTRVISKRTDDEDEW